MNAPCPSQVVITRAVSEGPDAPLARHLAACGSCSAEYRGLAASVRACRQLPAPALASARRRSLRAELLGRADALSPAPRPRSAGRRWIYAGLGLATAAVAGFLAAGLLSADPPSDVGDRPAPAAIVPICDDRCSRPLAEPERQPAPAPEIRESPAVERQPKRRNRPRSSAPARPVLFERGWAEFREHSYERAAVWFGKSAESASEREVREEARYWRGVALERVGDAAGAEAAYAQFLRHHPGSVRAGEANSALGWLLLAQRRRAEARTAFERALGDASDEVRASARSGLSAIDVDTRQ